MALKRTTIRRASKATLILWLFFNVMTVSVAAQEAEQTATGSGEQADTIPTPTADPEPAATSEIAATPSPTPTIESNTIITSEAVAVAETLTVVNANASTESGSLSDQTSDCPHPEGETECPTDFTLINDNTASASAEVTVKATTGDNQNEGSSGAASTITGDATATGTESSLINENSVIFVPASPLPDPVASAAPVSQPVTEVKITTNNTVSDTNNVTVSAESGNNISSKNVGEVLIETGDSQALAEVLNIMNTNVVGSQVGIVHLNLEVESGTDIDLNEVWKRIAMIDDTGMLQVADTKASYKLWMSVENGNTAELVNTVRVNANSGGNVSNGSGSAVTGTGDATAMANITNIVNTNILGSKFVWGTINILASQKVNLIFPRSTWFDPLSEISETAGVVVNNSSVANVDNQVTANADSGNNLTESLENSEVRTGNATAVTNVVNLVNTNINQNNWFTLLLNNMGGWSGRIVGWNSPTDIIIPHLGANIFHTDSSGSTIQSDSETADRAWEVTNNNQTSIVNDVRVDATSGNNQSTDNQGDTTIVTGASKALANLMNIVNTNIIGSKWFWANVNILGDWSGDAVFAYPDVELRINRGREIAQPGDHIQYTLRMSNTGRDEARGVKVKLNLPSGMGFVSDNGSLSGGCGESTCSWDVGDLEVGEVEELGVIMRVKDDFSFEKNQAFLEKFVPVAKAAEERKNKEIDVRGYVYSVDPETDMNNNYANAVSVVYEKQSQDMGIDQRQPVLSVTAKNNVNEFVYPSDTVTFGIKINNSGSVPAYQAALEQRIYTENGQYIGSSIFEIGIIEAGKTGTMNFGLTIPAKATSGKYKTVAVVTGIAPNGNRVSSDEAVTWFQVKTRSQPTKINEASETAPITNEQVLGTNIHTYSPGPMCEKQEDMWILIMLPFYWSGFFGNRVAGKRFRLIRRLFGFGKHN